MKRRPACWLFICACLGAWFGIKYCETWMIYPLIITTLVPLLNKKILSIMSVLCFTFLISSLAGFNKSQKFLKTVERLPKEEAVFYGHIFDVSKKRDGSTIALAHLSFKNSDENFVAKIKLIEACAAFDIKPGQEILFKSQAQAFLPSLSKAHFDLAQYGLVNNIHASFTIKELTDLWLGEVINREFFATLRIKLVKHMLKVSTPHEASLLLALMIGDTDLFSEEQNDIYRMLGVQHLLAVSGLQVTLLSTIVFFFFIPLFVLVLPRTRSHYAQGLSALCSLLLTFWFIGLCGFSSSAVRAFLMSAIMLLPKIFAKETDIFDAFFVSGFLSMIIWPQSIMDLGFLLSYAAVFSIIITHERSLGFKQLLQKKSRVLKLVVALFLSSTAAFLATLPIIAIFFRTFSPFSIVANLLLVPIASILQIPAIIFGLMGGLLQSAWLSQTATIFSNLIEIITEAVSHFLGKTSFVPPLSSWSLFFGLNALLLLFFCLLKKSLPLVMLSLLFTLVPLKEYLQPKTFQVVVIPVGQGDATLFSLPSGENFLVDAAGQPYGNFDPGKKIILPTLRQRGIKELDLLIISHPDPDHILGAFSILDEMPIKEIWHSGFKKDHPLTKQLEDVAFKKNIPIKNTLEILGEHRFKETLVEILAPKHPKNLPYFAEHSSNDNSLVLKVTHKNFRFLWTGDLELLGEKLLLDSKADIKAQVLKAPHHGSKTSSHQEFVDQVSPDHVIYSVGQNNRFGFPHEEVVGRYRAKNAQEWSTATEGEIIIKVINNELLVESFRPSFKKKTNDYYQVKLRGLYGSTAQHDQKPLR